MVMMRVCYQSCHARVVDVHIMIMNEMGRHASLNMEHSIEIAVAHPMLICTHPHNGNVSLRPTARYGFTLINYVPYFYQFCSSL